MIRVNHGGWTVSRLLMLVVVALCVYVLAACEPDDGRSRPSAAASQAPAGAEWTGAGRGGWTQAQFEAFRDYPLLWLGPSVAGLNLQEISRVHWVTLPPVPPSGGGAKDQFEFIYGACSSAPCTIPGHVLLDHICYLPPSAFTGPFQTVRGGALAQFAQQASLGDGPDVRISTGGRPQVRVWTGRITIDIRLPGDAASIDEAVAALQSPGPDPAVRPGDPLPPPDESDCDRSIYKEGPRIPSRQGRPAMDPPVAPQERSAAATLFTQQMLTVPAGRSARVSLAVNDLPAGVSGFHVAIAHPPSVAISRPRCQGPFEDGFSLPDIATYKVNVQRFEYDGVSVMGCFRGMGLAESASGEILSFVVPGAGDDDATLSLSTTPRLQTRFFAGGFAVGPGQTNTLTLTPR